MFSRPTHLPSRMVWFVALATLGLWQLFEGSAAGGLGSAFQGIGWLCFAVVAFMQPVWFNKSPNYSLANYERLAIGPRQLRTVLILAAFVILLAGVIFRFLGNVA